MKKYNEHCYGDDCDKSVEEEIFDSYDDSMTDDEIWEKYISEHPGKLVDRSMYETDDMEESVSRRRKSMREDEEERIYPTDMDPEDIWNDETYPYEDSDIHMTDLADSEDDLTDDYFDVDDASDEEIWEKYVSDNGMKRTHYNGFDYDELDESKGAYHRGRKYSKPSFDDKERAMVGGPAAEHDGPRMVDVETPGFKARRANNLKYKDSSSYKPVSGTAIDEAYEKIWDAFIESKRVAR